MATRQIAIEKLSHRLTDQDASFIYAESRNGPLHVGSISLFEDEIAFADLLRHFESKLHLVPRYRQRLVRVPFNLDHATLEDDPNFKLEDHVKFHQLPADASEDQLIEAAMAVFQKPLDRGRPLWETHLFNGLKGNRSAILWLIHHALVDGVSGMELLNVVMDFRPDAPAPEASAEPWSPKGLPGPIRQLIGVALDSAQEQVDSARRLTQVIPSVRSLLKDAGSDIAAVAKLAQQMTRPIADTPWTAGLVGQERTLAWLRTSFADIREIRAAFGGTMNDVVLTMLTEGASRYLRYHGKQEHAPFRVGCPVNVRRDEENGALGNRVSMMFPELPAEPMDPVARLKVVTKETQRIKDAGEPQALERLMRYSESISPAIVALIGGIATSAIDTAASLQRYLPSWATPAAPAPGINFVATNVPGSQVPLYLAGHRMVDYVGLLPLGANLGFGVPIISYNQNLYFTMMAEPKLMPDPALMKAFVEQVFDELRRAAIAQKAPVAEPAAPARKPKPAPAYAENLNGSAHPIAA